MLCICNFFYKVRTTKRQGKVMRQTSRVLEMFCLDLDGGYIQHTQVKFYQAVHFKVLYTLLTAFTPQLKNILNKR